MNEVYDKVQKCTACVRKCLAEQGLGDFTPRVALILGSGLGHFADTMQVVTTIDYRKIDGFPTSTVPGHVGRYVFGYVGDTPVVCMQGRVHYYEGYDITDVVLPTRIMGMLGAEVLFLTNASGGIREDLQAGDLMMILDHIATFIPSPLRGANIEELGTRFPDMTDTYDPTLRNLAIEKAQELQIDLKKGVYIQTPGPQYETPAEIRMCRTMGADAVGMSTACEAIAARHMGMRILGISCISNLAAGISPTPLSIEEIFEAGKIVEKKFTLLVTEIIKSL